VYQQRRKRLPADQPVGAAEGVLILIVVAAFAALIVSIIVSAGGGVLNQG
jgi:hypothetical protein